VTRATQSFGFLTKAGASPYTNASVSVMDSAKEMKFLKRKNPDIKLILSIGGWGSASTMTSIASSSDLRKMFISSLIRTIRGLGYDGLDVSWEFPTRTDAPYFTNFFTVPKNRRTVFIHEKTESLSLKMLFLFFFKNFF
jgi:chitinase